MSVATETFERRAAVDGAAVGLMLFLTFAWGLNGVAAKLSNQGFDPVFVTIVRSAIGAACVFAWCGWRGISLFDRDGTLAGGLAAGALFGIEFALIFTGLDYTTVARGALMVNTMPFWVLIGAHFLLGERMSLAKVGGTLLAFCGVALVFSDKLSLPGPEAIIGDLMSLAAGMAWAATIIVIKTTRLSTARAEKTLLYQLAVAPLVTLPLLLFTGPVLRDVGLVPIVSILFQGIFIVAFTYLLWFWLMRRYPAAGLSSFAFLTPAFGVLAGGILLDEPLSLRIFLALGLIGVGIVIVNRPVRKVAPG
ncbi:DMT family transporter [Aquibium sp. ELW1220]|uniref:DMT family transporter n=1 Tax=Aquibium sp. ELW1220 TaxID=2976766 RepID=UPI0025AF3774|nr:DMT family transporter [Aquibium sp. ELW1220]MDN2580332.1 DMT family transporter [Aquibium sp. ELW1220]